MFSETTFALLQNEGYLMQRCFKSSLRELRLVSSGEPGQFYFVFFNYGIGFERLLKIILMLDQWHKAREFPTDGELKKYGGNSGHNLEKLHESVRPLFLEYKIEWKTNWDLDAINKDFIVFLASFANGNRYFNLAQLADYKKHYKENPVWQWEELFYRVYNENCLKDGDRKARKPNPPEEPGWGHHAVMAGASPHVCWRLIQLLIPLQALLIAICEQIHKDDFRLDGQDANPSVPYMEAFLDFVCDDKAIILESKDYEDWS
jgi:hypothetical protein